MARHMTCEIHHTRPVLMVVLDDVQVAREVMAKRVAVRLHTSLAKYELSEKFLIEGYLYY